MRANLLTVTSVALVMVAAALAGCTTPGGDTNKPLLKLGTLLDLSGSLNAYGPNMQKATDVAAAQVNGAPNARFRLQLAHADDQTQPGPAVQEARRLVTEGAVGIVGATASSITKATLEVTQPNRVVQITPSSTDPGITTEYTAKRAPGDRYFFRTAPHDGWQGKVAGYYAQGRGWDCVVVLYVNNDYGNGLKGTFIQNYGNESGACVPGQRTARVVSFSEKQTSYDSELATALAGCTTATPALCPDVVFFIAYPLEGKVILREWWSRPQWRNVPWLMSEGMKDQATFQELAGAGVRVGGFEGTYPQSTAPGAEAFFDLLGTRNATAYQDTSFDAVMILALAAEKAGKAEGPAIRDAVRAVAGPPGTKVGPKDFDRAAGLLKQGQDIDYEGAGGAYTFDEFGDVTSPYEVWRVNDDGSVTRKCLITEAGVIATPPVFPPDCMGAPTRPPGPPPGPPQPPPPGAPTLVNITARQSGCTLPAQFCFEASSSSIKASANITATLVNPAANTGHSLCVQVATNTTCVPPDAMMDPTKVVAPGQTGSLSFNAPASGTVTYFCNVTGHRALGMEGRFSVD